MISVFRTRKHGWSAISHCDSVVIATVLPWGNKAEVKERIERMTVERCRAIKLQSPLESRRWPELEDKFTAYFDGERVSFNEQVNLEGFTKFQKAVLKAARDTGYGQTTTYGELAKRAGSPKAARGVGGALGSNAAPLVIPCHRIIRKSGALGGFSAMGGIKIKENMLKIEGII